MFSNKSGGPIHNALVQQIEQDIANTKAQSWEAQEAEVFLGRIFHDNDPKDFEHLIFNKDTPKPTTRDIEHLLCCDNLPYNYGNKTQDYMKWLVREITMPDEVQFFNHLYFTRLINLQTLYHLNNKYKMRYFNKPYGADSMQSVGYWIKDNNKPFSSKHSDFISQHGIMSFNDYSYVAIVHDEWQDDDADMFRVQLPDIKNNCFYQKHFFIAAQQGKPQVCAHGLSESMAKQALMKKIEVQRNR